MGMTEHDRVLDAFRNCITEPKCKDCPWTECETIGHSTIEIPRDLALAVMRELVAHEPRVMTLEEVKTLPSETDVWLDEFCSIIVAATISCTLYGNAYFYGIEHADYGVDYKLIDYGKEWRCWTSRPDQATMEATPWN